MSLSLERVVGSAHKLAAGANLAGEKVVNVVGGTTDTDWYYVAETGGITNTTDRELKAAAGAGKRNYLTALQLANPHATVATEIVVKDGSTVIWRGHMRAVSVPFVIEFNRPLRSSANAAFNVACITTGAQVYVSAQGYTD